MGQLGRRSPKAPGTFDPSGPQLPSGSSRAPTPYSGASPSPEPGARTVEVDTPLGWTLMDWQAYAERYHGRGCAVTAVAGFPSHGAPSTDEALRTACDGVAGITPAQFRALGVLPGAQGPVLAGSITDKILGEAADPTLSGPVSQAKIDLLRKA